MRRDPVGGLQVVMTMKAAGGAVTASGKREGWMDAPGLIWVAGSVLQCLKQR